MFRGIDPEGLDGLAGVLDVHTGSLRHQARIALDLLHRNQRGSDATSIGALLSRAEDWGIDSSDTLRWRAATIRSGQDAGFDVCRLARARFAAEAVFSFRNVEDEYRAWIERLQASRRRADEAAGNIAGWLDQRWTDWDVTNGDLHNIHRTLEGLSGAELDQVIAALSPRQLERWIEEMGNSINGFSRNEKQEVFSLLAASSSGESLGKVHDAILASSRSEDAVDLGMEIRRISPDQVILAFVRNVIGRGLIGHQYAGLAPALAADGIEDSATSNQLLRAISSDDEALRLILVDSLVTTRNAGRSDRAYPGPFDSLVDAIARSDDPGLKAVAFAAVAEMATNTDGALRGLLRDRHQILDTTTTNTWGMREHDRIATEILRTAESKLLTNAATILAADANGVVEQLATNLDADGSGLTRYLHELVDQGEIGHLGRVVDSLRGGEVTDAVRFSDPGVNPDYRYPHAQNLGFMAGSLRGALERYAADSKNDIDWIAAGAEFATVAVGVGFTKALEGLELAGIAIEGTAEWASADYWASKTQDEIDEGLDTLLDDVASSLQPPLSPTGGPPQLGNALRWWTVRYESIRNR